MYGPKNQALCTRGCSGIKKDGTPCRISWDLDENGFCKHHRTQASTPASPVSMASSASVSASSVSATSREASGGVACYCSGIKKDGTPCRISWDLDENGFCKHHRTQASTPASPVSTASLTLSDDDEIGLAGGFGDGLSATTVNVQMCAGVTKKGAPCTRRAKPDSDGMCFQHRDHRTEDELRRNCPPLWTATYSMGDDKLELLIKSEWSQRAFHDPIEIKSYSKMANWNPVAKKAAEITSSCVEVLLSPAKKLGEAAMETIRYADQVATCLARMKINSSSGSYDSDPDCMSKRAHDDREILEKLLKLRDPDFQMSHISNICNLFLRTDVNGRPIWVTEFEGEHYEAELIRDGGLTRVLHAQTAQSSVELIFTDVKGKVGSMKNADKISWLLQDSNNQILETGDTVPNEPTVVQMPTDTNGCKLKITASKGGDIFGQGVVSLCEVLKQNKEMKVKLKDGRSLRVRASQLNTRRHE